MSTKRLVTNKKYWITKDGISVQINMMPTSHLLNAIHFIERSRMQQINSIREQWEERQIDKIVPIDVDDWKEFLEYYSSWPEGYEDLLEEAEKRKLIKRKK